MNFLKRFLSRKQEVLKTDELRHKTHSEVTKVKDALDSKFAHLSQLVDDALAELSERRRQEPLHPKGKQ